MANAAQELEISPQEFLVRERQAEFRHEYVSGQIFAMSGASRRHNLVTGNAFGELRNQLKGRRCEIYTGDMRVRVEGARFYTYPDVVVTCGLPRFEDDQFDTLLNPTVIIEVLSPSTASYDPGDKFAYYRQIASLQEYVLIFPDELLVELHTRRGENWDCVVLNRQELELHLASIDCHLLLAEIYSRVPIEKS